MLTAEQIAEIETKASTWGCGAYNCVDCSPLQYRCADCYHEDEPFEFSAPVLNGTQIECEQCGWINNEDEQHTYYQLKMFAKYRQSPIADKPYNDLVTVIDGPTKYHS